jgi:hypothetical protein
MFADCIHRFVASVAAWYARRIAWSPCGERVALDVRASRDATLQGQRLRGVIRATSPDADAVEAKAVISLDSTLSYFGHYRRGGITTIRATPERRWHSLNRLLIASIRVRIIDCEAYDDDTQDRVIAVATMRLERRLR